MGAQGTDTEHLQAGSRRTATDHGRKPGVSPLVRSKRGTRLRTATLVGGTKQRGIDLAQIAFCAFRVNLEDAGPAFSGIGCIEFSRKVKNEDTKTHFFANIRGSFPFTSTFNSQPGVQRHE
jgi:hypothetical protein